MTIVDVQFSPAHCEWAELRDACLAADAGPFGALWVYDHLAGRTLAGGHTNLECFSLLGALAELTDADRARARWSPTCGTVRSARS